MKNRVSFICASNRRDAPRQIAAAGPRSLRQPGVGNQAERAPFRDDDSAGSLAPVPSSTSDLLELQSTQAMPRKSPQRPLKAPASQAANHSPVRDGGSEQVNATRGLLNRLIALLYASREEPGAQTTPKGEAPAAEPHVVQAVAAAMGMVSHELRTPLQTLLANLEMLSFMPLPPDLAPVIERMQRSADLMAARLENVAQYVQLARGVADTQRPQVDVAPVLQQILDETSAGATQRIVLKAEGLRGRPIQIDPTRLHQIVSNYLSNALKYAGDGTITVAGEFSPGEGNQGRTLEITVSDEGPGIDPARRAEIWEPFVRAQQGQGLQEGSGLGLTIVRMLAMAAGWEVGVRSAQGGHGITFYVQLPCDVP
jgi:signal transduction histidine kinase